MIDASGSTWPELESAWGSGKIAVLAFGAQEEHGPHCPLATDTWMANGLATRLAAELDAVLLPAVPYGEAWSTSGYPGTISLSPDTVKQIVMDIGMSLKGQGARALVVVNGHFGNKNPIDLACRDLKRHHAFPVLCLDYPGLEEAAKEVCSSEPAAPSFYHADEVETSIMLALAPACVKMDKAVEEYPVFPSTFGSEPIMLDSICRSGVFGDPRSASADKGERLLRIVTDRSLSIVRDFLERARG
jgi:creatinine amidohydrolase